MKNVILTFCLVATAGITFGQVKVISNGAVGINQSTPVSQLHVNASGSDFVIAGQQVVANLEGEFSVVRQRINSINAENSGLVFSTLNTKRFSTAAYNPNAGNTDYVFYNDQNSSSALFIDGDNNNANFGGTVSSMGSLLTSDKRMKKNIKSYEGGLKKVLQINPVSFQYNNTKMNINMNNRQFIGVIAQELQKIDPSLVSNYSHHVVDENLNPTGEVVEYLQIQSDAVQYLLVNAIKDQQKIIEEKESRIRSLEDQVSEIKEFLSEIVLTQEGVNRNNVELNYHDLALLEQNIPNPFQARTSINYVVPNEAKSAQITIYNNNGKVLKTIPIDHVGDGILDVDAFDLPASTYTYQLVVDGKLVDTKKMVLSK